MPSSINIYVKHFSLLTQLHSFLSIHTVTFTKITVLPLQNSSFTVHIVRGVLLTMSIE